MSATAQEIGQRAPVWSALSQLFLDTELRSEDETGIANVLAKSPYSLEKLEEILKFEVTPVLKGNLLSVAGVWTDFDEAWMREQMAPLIDKGAILDCGIFPMVRDQWCRIHNLTSLLRVGGNATT